MFCLISYKRVVRDQDLSFRITHKVYWKDGVQVTIVFPESCLWRNCWLEWEVFCFPPTISPTPLTVLQNKTFEKTIKNRRRLFATLLSATVRPPPAPLSRWCWADHFVHPSAYFVWSEETKWAADVETNVWNDGCREPAGPHQACAGADAKLWGAASSSTGFCRKKIIIM